MMKKDISKTNKELGSQLKNARERAKLTQADIASAVGMHANWYARVERGEETPSLESLQKLMKALRIKTLNINSES
jgi:transcriptional regulator with XRE-family HTH domain